MDYISQDDVAGNVPKRLSRLEETFQNVLKVVFDRFKMKSIGRGQSLWRNQNSTLAMLRCLRVYSLRRNKAGNFESNLD